MPNLIETDVAIIGAGPVGLFAAFECGMLKLRTALVDALDEVGGQCSALYPEKPIYDIPAHPAIAAGHLITNLEQQIAPFDVPRLLGRRVDRLQGQAGRFVLGTDEGDEIRCKAVVVAAGAGDFVQAAASTPTRANMTEKVRIMGMAASFLLASILNS